MARATGIHLWLVLWKAYSSLRRRAESNVASLGLGLSDFAVLEILLHKGPLPVNTIGSKVELTSGSISVAVDRLVRDGLVERKGSPEDRRARIVHLTAKGRRLIEKAFASHSRAMEEAVAGLDRSERESIVELLKKLGTGAEEPEDDE